MDDYRGLSLELREGGLLIVTIQGRDAVNSLDEEDHLELARLWRDLNRQPEVRAVVVTGAGNAFCGGGNLEMERRAAGNYARIVQTLEGARELVHGIVACDKPIVSAINGPAAGAGLAVALLADISIVGHDVVLADGHVRIGLAAGDHAALLWPLLCGLARSKRYLLMGERVDGRTAAEIGLVSKSVERDRVLPEALDIAQRLTHGSEAAIRFTKRSLNYWLTSALPAFDASLALEMVNMFGADFAEGVDAFLGKRPPKFGDDQMHPPRSTHRPIADDPRLP